MKFKTNFFWCFLTLGRWLVLPKRKICFLIFQFNFSVSLFNTALFFHKVIIVFFAFGRLLLYSNSKYGICIRWFFEIMKFLLYVSIIQMGSNKSPKRLQLLHL
ncbi:MAG: hypothetical protein DRI32_00640 [Chloroflexi bacterium]|nr:MAG: hypothetical protein DRI32_00640 [Chloroflexota bacterium]